MRMYIPKEVVKHVAMLYICIPRRYSPYMAEVAYPKGHITSVTDGSVDHYTSLAAQQGQSALQ